MQKLKRVYKTAKWRDAFVTQPPCVRISLTDLGVRRALGTVSRDQGVRLGDILDVLSGDQAWLTMLGCVIEKERYVEEALERERAKEARIRKYKLHGGVDNSTRYSMRRLNMHHASM